MKLVIAAPKSKLHECKSIVGAKYDMLRENELEVTNPSF